MAYPFGAGNLLMSGCFGTDYKANDPCYELAIPIDQCPTQIDAANFIGAGYDATLSYSAESRYGIHFKLKIYFSCPFE